MEYQKYKHRIKSEYEENRDLLIPIAERYADDICGKEPKKTAKNYRDWVDFWNRHYHRKMTELAMELL